MWSGQELENHKKAARLLLRIKDLAFEFISLNKRVSEYDVQQFILRKFKEFNLKTDKFPPIVAFGKNTAIIHYYDAGKKRKARGAGYLVLIDLWARLKTSNSPFADITWMAFNGNNIPKEIRRKWGIIVNARDESIKFLKKSLAKGVMPSGKQVNKITRDIMDEEGLGEAGNYYSGHCIGFYSSHGAKANLSKSNHNALIKNLGYSIEPGIHVKNKSGLRSETNFFISSKNKLILTTSLQKKIICL